jgi:hypothetical protein
MAGQGWLPRSLHCGPQKALASAPFGFAQGRRDDGTEKGEERPAADGGPYTERKMQEHRPFEFTQGKQECLCHGEHVGAYWGLEAESMKAATLDFSLERSSSRKYIMWPAS